jgi:hypothetical protein
VRRFPVLLLALGLAVVLMGAGAGSASSGGPSPIRLPADAPTPSASDFSRSILTVSGVVVGDAASASPSKSPTGTPAPIESIAGETGTPYSGATPPPTSSWSALGGAAGSTPIFLLLICLVLACGLMAAVQYQRRKHGRRF